jgi:hypothetical protein
VLPPRLGIAGGAIPMTASTDQKSATANIAIVTPVKYEMAISFPFLIILLLIKSTACINANCEEIVIFL